MSDTTSNTEELDDDDDVVEPTQDEDATPEAKPTSKRSTGLRKPPTPAARGAMGAVAMAAVPATGLSGALLYGNFGPMGVVAAGGVAAAAGVTALAVRGRKRAEATKDGKAKDKPGLPPHPLGGLKRLLGGASEKARARRDAMAQQRAARQQGRQGAGRVAGLLNRRGTTGGGPAAAGGRGRSTPGVGGGRGAQRGVAGRPAAGAAGRAAAGSRQPSAAKPGSGRAAGRSAAGTIGRGAAGRVAAGRGGASGTRPTSGGRGHAATQRPNAAAGRYVNPVAGRPMTAAQVSRAIRQQTRAQRIITDGGGYPTQIARWAVRHPRIAGWAVLGTLGVAGLASVVIPAAMTIAPAAGWLTTPALAGLATYCASRHPAVRRLRRKLWVEAKYRSILAGRWMRARWRRWRGVEDEPLIGEFVPGHTPKPQPVPEPDIVDAEVMPDLDAEFAPAAQPELVMTPPATGQPHPEPEEKREPLAPPHRQPHLLTAGNTSTINEEKKVMHPFETVNEALANVTFVPESGADAEEAVDAIPGVLSAAAESIRSVLTSIAEHLPQTADSLEHLNGIADAVDGISTQANEQITGWKESANWVWQGQN